MFHKDVRYESGLIEIDISEYTFDVQVTVHRDKFL